MQAKSDDKVEFMLFDSYLAAINNAVGSDFFRDLFVKINGEQINVAGHGQRSCALLVSWILRVFNLIGGTHANTASTIKDIENSGWVRIDQPKIGCIILWEAMLQGEDKSQHVGFYIGNDEAISNDWVSKVPAKHHWTFGEKNGWPVRKVEALYWHDKLKN